ncbi:MAG: YbjN domain-containing protein [Kofleriaceae bacterium]|nr:YbjN domain-containing protein [Myxococcales bacterium]MCB9563679.1 YbjN domain-containing protein [Kofleriaceae bacterium]MCB9571162.1 YbjN domain-containing protein [Kofleriaceae bacterium]
MTATGPRNTGDLFANHRDVNLASTVAMIEDLLIERGYFLNDCRADREGTLHSWTVPKGSALARISLLDRADFPHLRVASAVMRPPGDVDKIALYQHLLTRNAELCGAAFALAGDHVVLIAERSTLDLDRSELAELVTRVLTYADDYDDALVAEFGGEAGGDLVP